MNEKEILERIAQEKVSLQERLSEVLQLNVQLNSQVNEKEKELTQVKESLNLYKTKIGDADAIKAVTEGLRKWIELSPLKDYAAATGFLKQDGQDLSKLASVLEEISKYFALGSQKEITEQQELLKQYKELASVEHLTKVLDLLEEFSKLGAPQEVKKRLASGQKLRKLVNEARRKAAAKKIGEQLEVNADAVFEMLKKMSAKEVIASLKKMRDSRELKDRYRVSEEKQTKKTEGRTPKLSFLESVFSH